MKENYKYVKNMVSKDLANFLTLHSIKTQTYSDPQCPNSSTAHSSESEIYKHMLFHLLPIMEHETNLKLKPIYSYNRVYYGGSELERHLDKSQCEISASISLNYKYENKNYKWPLCMGDMPIVINVGDGVIYRGTKIEHWRPVFNQPKKCWHHQLFVHYVDLNGAYKDYELEEDDDTTKRNVEREKKINDKNL